MNIHHVKTIARTDLLQLAKAKDFIIPMAILGTLFFVAIPATLLFTITSIGEVGPIQQVSEALDALPDRAVENLRGDTPSGRTAYALSVYLFAPLAIIVPLMISSSVGAASIVGEREKGTGEFLAHSPAGTTDIYLGKLIASFIPGYVTTLVGFGIYSLIVNLIVGPEVGGWFFPTLDWLVLMLWVVPPFLVIALSVVVRISARLRSTAAAHQAAGLVSLPTILVAYSQSTGAMFGETGATVLIGALAWLVGGVSIWRAVRSVRRSRLLSVAES
ncbi:MAG: ABC transporter permease subunit [Acidimicrobiales bacterium]